MQSFLPYADPIYFHGDRKSILVNALASSPASTPCEIQDHVKRSIVRPIDLSGTWVGIIESLLAIDIELEIILGPLHAIDMELSFSAFTFDFLGDLRAIRVDMTSGMEADRKSVV